MEAAFQDRKTVWDRTRQERSYIQRLTGPAPLIVAKLLQHNLMKAAGPTGKKEDEKNERMAEGGHSMRLNCWYSSWRVKELNPYINTSTSMNTMLLTALEYAGDFFSH